MTQAVVLGNGESRKGIDLNLIKRSMPLIACNAAHRDIVADHLVCVDQRMVREALGDPNTKDTLIYVREEWYHTFKKLMKYKNIRQVPDLPFISPNREDQPRNWGSGSYALLLAASKFDHIFVVGFDLYGNGNSVNNIYKGTENYAAKGSPAVDPGYWIYHASTIFKQYPNTRFSIVHQKGWVIPESWRHSNTQFLTVEIFQSLLQKQ